MKKVLSIVLSLVMVLCMLPTMAFADTAAAYNDIAGETCENAVTTLSGLGVVDGYPDGSYKPEVAVKRAEAAKLIIAALGLEKEAAGTKASFTDLEGYAWAEGYIGYAESLGILKGDGNGLYRPGDVVSYNEMAAIVIRALGYTDDALQGTFPAAHVAKAKALGAFKDVVSGGSAGADRGDCAIMIFNVLGEEIVAVDNQGYFQGTKTSMIENLGAKASTPAVVTLENARAAKVDLYDYVGAYATLYVTDDANADIIAVGDVESTFLTGKFSSNLSKFEADGVTYSVDVTPTDDMELKNLKADTSVDPTDGSVLTIAAKVSGKKITAIYTINKWDGVNVEMNATYVNALAKTDKLANYEFVMDNNGEIDTTSFDLLGVDSLADIKDEDIVTIYNADKVIKVEVSDATVTGKISKAVDSKVTIDGTVYEVATGVTLPDIGNEAVFHLNYAGKIASVSDVESDANYGVVTTAPKAQNAEFGTTDKVTKIELFTEAGAETVFDYHKNVAITGTVKLNSFVKYELNSNNEITEIKVIDVNQTATKYMSAGYLDGKEIAEDVVVFTKTSAGKYALSSLSAIPTDKDLVKTKYCMENNVVTVIFTEDVAVATVYGFVSQVADIEDADGNDIYEVTLIDGTVYETTTSTTNANTLAKGDTLFKLGLEGGKIATVATETKTEKTVAGVNVAKNTIDAGSGYELIASNAQIYKTVKDINGTVTGLEKAELIEVSALDKVVLYETNDKVDGYDFVVVTIV